MHTIYIHSTSSEVHSHFTRFPNEKINKNKKIETRQQIFELKFLVFENVALWILEFHSFEIIGIPVVLNLQNYFEPSFYKEVSGVPVPHGTL